VTAARLDRREALELVDAVAVQRLLLRAYPAARPAAEADAKVGHHLALLERLVPEWERQRLLRPVARRLELVTGDC
jgi:hypothetical protein